MARDAWSAVPMVGTFQKGERIRCEDPRSEIWKMLSRFGTLELATRSCNNTIARDRPRLVAARIRQGVELREAARQSTILTAPLLQYYSFQNLVRGFAGMRIKEEPPGSHGVEFVENRDLLETSAKSCASGTFPTLLRFLGVDVEEGYRINLKDCLLSIPEIRDATNMIGENRVVRVRATAYFNGEKPIELRVLSDGEVPLEKWHPALNEQVSASAAPRTYLLDRPPGEAGTLVGDHLSEWMFSDLRVRDQAAWYFIRRDLEPNPLPRAAYYFLASFMLSNVVRYQPLLLAKYDPGASELGWMLSEFLNAADRHFPQLLLSAGRKHPLLFG